MATVHREKFPGICLRDANTGEKLFDLRHDYGQVNKVAFSKDGKILASGGWAVAGPTELGPPDLSDALHIWDIGAKRSLRRFPGNPTTIDRDRKQRLISDIAISPDGRTLATVEGLAIVLREVATGGMRKTLKGHQEEITGAVFDPKGRSLISVSWDNTALVWDLTGHIRNGSFQPSSLSPQQAEALWADLAGADTAKAYQSIWTLMTAPDATVALMQKRLRPIPAVNSQHIDDLIAALDDHHYAARRNASQELERLGELAEPALRRILASGPSAEVRRRIEDLLRIERELPPPQLRVLRSIEVLEQAYAQLQAQVAQTTKEIEKLVDEERKLTEQIGNGKEKGLRADLAAVQLKERISHDEEEFLKPLLYNRQVEYSLLMKRQQALEARIKELQGLSLADQP